MNPRSICRLIPATVSPWLWRTVRNTSSLGMPRSFLNSLSRLSASLAAASPGAWPARRSACSCGQGATISSMTSSRSMILPQLLRNICFLAGRPLGFGQANQLAHALVDGLADLALVDRVVADARRRSAPERRRPGAGRVGVGVAGGVPPAAGRVPLAGDDGGLARRGRCRATMSESRMPSLEWRIEPARRADHRGSRPGSVCRGGRAGELPERSCDRATGRAGRSRASSSLPQRVRQSILRFSSRACWEPGPDEQPASPAASRAAAEGHRRPDFERGPSLSPSVRIETAGRL